ncbi:MAG: LamG domain-containing protein [Gemmataceae bacterium]|nr:LamG domain-containing protein [Gemmataceae bacterium]
MTTLLLCALFADPAWRHAFDDKTPGKAAKAKKAKDDAGPYLELDGEGHWSIEKPKADPAKKDFAIGAKVWLDGNTGVIAAHGGEEDGFALHVDDREPVFSVRSAGKLFQAKAGRKLARGRWFHVMGVLEGGKLRVWIDGKEEGKPVPGEMLTATPKDGLSFGADTGSWVGGYKSDNPLTGKLRDARLYWKTPAEKELLKWAGVE